MTQNASKTCASPASRETACASAPLSHSRLCVHRVSAVKSHSWRLCCLRLLLYNWQSAISRGCGPITFHVPCSHHSCVWWLKFFGFHGKWNRIKPDQGQSRSKDVFFGYFGVYAAGDDRAALLGVAVPGVPFRTRLLAGGRGKKRSMPGRLRSALCSNAVFQ
jgi:hypothetical protein